MGTLYGDWYDAHNLGDWYDAHNLGDWYDAHNLGDWYDAHNLGDVGDVSEESEPIDEDARLLCRLFISYCLNS